MPITFDRKLACVPCQYFDVVLYSTAIKRLSAQQFTSSLFVVIKFLTILYIVLSMSPQLVGAVKLVRWIRHVTELVANVTVKQKSLEGTVPCAR